MVSEEYRGTGRGGGDVDPDAGKGQLLPGSVPPRGKVAGPECRGWEGVCSHKVGIKWPGLKLLPSQAQAQAQTLAQSPPVASGDPGTDSSHQAMQRTQPCPLPDVPFLLT